jgi:cytochrome P450
MEGMAGFKDYLSPFVEDRLAHPGADLLSLLVSGEQDGVYTRDQVLANASVMLIAGQEATANLIGNSLLAFLRHPDQWQRFQQDQSSKAVARAVNECLRYDAPQKSVQRIATEDVELRGKAIRQGDRVRCFIASANRDPEMFEAPDTFDITRYPNRHVAFGFGSHY